MATREKKLKVVHLDLDEEANTSKTPIVLTSTSDEEDNEANEDLSLKIVQKAKLRATDSRNNGDWAESNNAVIIDLTELSSHEDEAAAVPKKKKKRGKKKKKIVTPGEAVDVANEEEKAETSKAETSKAVEVDTSTMEGNPVVIFDNTVLPKLTSKVERSKAKRSKAETNKAVEVDTSTMEGNPVVIYRRKAETSKAETKKAAEVDTSTMEANPVVIYRRKAETSKAETKKAVEVDASTMEGNPVVISDNTLLPKLTSKAEISKAETNKAVEVDTSTVEGNPVVISDKAVLPKLIVDVAKAEEIAETSKTVEFDTSLEANPVEISDNTVLRKLLRGPRYFDPPDSSWGTCYNCGEEGHASVNCTSARRKKPCFVCGSLDHFGKKCVKAQDCFICKKGGHVARDCPEKYRAEHRICLKCGGSGHEMFTCKNVYSQDDLKEIQCYICKSFGHLCCANAIDTGPREVSCYRCGQLGHSGLGCGRARGEFPSTPSTPSSCYRCGEGGHFARECTSSAKVSTSASTDRTGTSKTCYKCGGKGHVSRECATSANKVTKRNSDLSGARSVPRDISKASKRKKSQYEGEFATPSKSKQRGGWITEDPGDFPRRKPKSGGWRSPATPPSHKKIRLSAFNNSGHSSSSRFQMSQDRHFGTPTFNGSANYYQHRYPESRFGDYSSDGLWRNYHHW